MNTFRNQLAQLQFLARWKRFEARWSVFFPTAENVLVLYKRVAIFKFFILLTMFLTSMLSFGPQLSYFREQHFPKEEVE